MTTPATRRCPSCAASLRADAPWCTLCYADLRPPPAPEPAPVLRVPPTAAYSLPQQDPLAVDPLTDPVQTPPEGPVGRHAAPEATWPCATCGAANALTLMTCTGCGAGFLSGLREAEGPLLELPVVGDLGALSRGQRLGLAAGVVLAVLVLVLVLGLLFS